jgi:predicted HicB family RNase H-like nuclease
MNKLMSYKGYQGKIEYDDDAGIFHGIVINTRDVITFEGESVKELRKAIRDAIDEYLDYCSRNGKEPDKPYSGRFLIRVKPELHKMVAMEAEQRGMTMNKFVAEALEKIITP